MADGLLGDIAKDVGGATSSIAGVADANSILDNLAAADALRPLAESAAHALDGLTTFAGAPHDAAAVAPELDSAVAHLQDLVAKDPDAIQHLTDQIGGAQSGAPGADNASGLSQSSQAADALHAQEALEATRHQLEEMTHLLQQQADAEKDVMHNLGGGGSASGGFGAGTGSAAADDLGVAMAHDTTHATVDAMPIDAHAEAHADAHAEVHEALHVDHQDGSAPVIEAHPAGDVDATVAEPAIGGVNAKSVTAVRDSAPAVVEQAQVVAAQTADVSATTDPHSAHDSATSAHDDHGHHDSHDTHEEEEPTVEEHHDDTPPAHEEPAAEWHAADPTPAHTD